MTENTHELKPLTKEEAVFGARGEHAVGFIKPFGDRQSRVTTTFDIACQI